MTQVKDKDFYIGTFGFTVASVSLVGLVTTWYMPMLPEFVKHQVNPYPETNTTVQFTENQVKEITSKLDENKEYGWCLETSETESGDVYKVVDLRTGVGLNRSSNSVEFTCMESADGRIHTHPGRFGVALPSEHDANVIEHGDRSTECIAANIGQVKCFKNSGSRIEEIEVSI